MEKGEIARNEQFFPFPQCFLPFWVAFYHFHHILNCHLKTLSLWKSLKLDVWERVNAIVWCLMPISIVFQLYHGGQSTCLCFPWVLLTSTLHNILSKPHLPDNHCWNNGQRWESRICQITVVETMDSGERGMNPVAMTIINSRKEYWPSRASNQRLPVLKSATLWTELWGSAVLFWVRKATACYTEVKYFHL